MADKFKASVKKLHVVRFANPFLSIQEGGKEYHRHAFTMLRVLLASQTQRECHTFQPCAFPVLGTF
jgi:hypothetical protein